MEPLRVMIVEDEMLVQLHLEQIVAEMGHEVVGRATTAGEAVARAALCKPEVVLLDIQLRGGTDGMTVARALREQFGCEVVFATARGEEAMLKRAEAVGAAAYLVKPFSTEDVHLALQVALTRRPAANRSVGRTATAPARFGAGTRMLVYSHDTLGVGHLQRSLKLIRAVIKRHPDTSVLLVTGSPIADRYELPDGADYVKLPAVRKVGSNDYEARSLPISGDSVRSIRSNLLLRVVKDYEPNVLLADHAPLGMKEELKPSLEWLTARGGCRRILGLRDVIDDAAIVTESWKRSGIYESIQTYYDHVVVYGSPDLYDTVSEYGLVGPLAHRTQYVGYVCEDFSKSSEGPAGGQRRRPRVAVSIGGGDGAGSMLIAYLEMLRRFQDDLEVDSELLTGPLASSDLVERVRGEAEGLPVVVREFMPSTAEWFTDADLVVSTAGYNTVTGVLAHAKRALLIPRLLHRREQLVRARRLEAMGLVGCLHPLDTAPERMFTAVRTALGSAESPLEAARVANRLPLDGAQRFAEFCDGLEVEARVAS